MKQQLDFIVIGAQRCGTTSLFEYLRYHPELHLPPEKEIPYFTHGVHRESWEEYMQRFASADPARRWGTVTPQYMVGGLQWPDPASTEDWGDPRVVPLRIRERITDPRLIAILRDPVERARSHHGWATEVGWEVRNFEAAARDLLAPKALERARARPEETTGYIAWGEYGRILAGYYDVFGPDRILVVYTSELEHTRQAVLRRIFAFLDVADDYVPDNLGTKYRATAMVPRRWPGVKRRMDSVHATVASNGFARRLGLDRQVDRLVWRVESVNRRFPRNEFPHLPIRSDDVASDETSLERELRRHFEVDGELLMTMLETSPPWLSREPLP